jgi:AcrR family transcriptional regulator
VKPQRLKSAEKKRSDHSAFWHTAEVSAPAVAKTLRSDARRNRAALVASARELFAREGVDVPVEEITHHAGLGMGTLYRHFSTKDELIDAVLEDAFAEILRLAEEAVCEQDAWSGFTRFLERALELHAQNRGVKDMLASRQHGLRHADAMRRRIRPLLARLIERAQEQGSLRADFTPEDLPLLFWSAGRVIETTVRVAPAAWRRHLGLMLDGLRAEAATPLAAPPLTRAQVTRARGARGA